MANIIGTNGNDTLLGTTSADTINGKLGNDTITGNKGNDTLTGGGGKDRFIYNLGDGTDTITDFGGIGKGTNPTPGVIAEVDTIKFIGAGLTARNLLLTQNGTNLEITFEGVAGAKVVLKNFKLEDLENLKASGSTPAIGNIIFDGQTSIVDSFNVLDANSTETSIGIKNTVTFLNDLANNITALDNSNDLVNGQGGNDKIDGKSGNDLLRGGAGNDTLIGGGGNDTLNGDADNDTLNVDFSQGDNLLNGGNGSDYLSASGLKFDETIPGYVTASGNNTLNGGAGNDILDVDFSSGENLLNGGDGNDYLSAAGEYLVFEPYSNNTLYGGAGDDTFNVNYSGGQNLLYGGDGNDSFSLYAASGNVYGGGGNDVFRANYLTGNNLFDGGDGNDVLDISGIEDYRLAEGNNTLYGGAGDDYLNIDYSSGDNLIDGGDGNDIFSAVGVTGNSTIDGGTGNDLLEINYFNAASQGQGITSTFNATTKIGSISPGANQVSYKNIERLNIIGTYFYDDKIVGSNGNDTLAGSSGNDSLYGGAGSDTFAFNSFDEGSDRIYDFDTTNEVIQISAAGFGGFAGGLSAGVLSASQFRIGTSANTSRQRFIYNSTTGALFFDQDGNAGGFAQVKFAQLSGGLSLTNNNFVVVEG
ncbi:MAG: calcium-binding protein [Nostoc sp. DedQUE12a]|nr:calcium-binding protein [Nostoc sp. DedQUE12a]